MTGFVTGGSAACWLKPGIRTIFRPWVNRADRKQLRNLARLAEERAIDGSAARADD